MDGEPGGEAIERLAPRTWMAMMWMRRRLAPMEAPGAIRLRLELEKQKTLQAEAEARKAVAES
jgi:hypothetical protein